MRFLGNIIWIVFGGLISAISLLILGILFCITIVGIPLGLQLFKMASFVLWPFGKEVRKTNINLFKRILNIIWAIFLGWEFALVFLFIGVIYCISVIGIPFGMQYFKLALFVLLPLGRDFI